MPKLIRYSNIVGEENNINLMRLFRDYERKHLTYQKGCAIL